MQILLPILKLLALDALLLGLFALLLTPVAIYKRAAFAVLKRNFTSYFSTPTGYVFLCLFVLLTSLAAFWPHDFFNSNLATLDQLSVYLPYIMLVFIPAITMSIWADERRQGTDELLLTMPADDFDIVLGKYLAAASIFTASLLFSQISNFAVLNALALGEADLGLFFTTYIGYWCIGMAMLAIGMVASFLTGNLTVGFILGALFNAPLVFAAKADVIISNSGWQRAIAWWSYLKQFEDFGRGVFSLSSISYFAMLVVLGVYLSMVLIGRRHWLGGRDGDSMLGHYLVRALSLVAIIVGLNLFLSNYDRVRIDASSAQLSSLSADTRKLITDLGAEHTVHVEAFISKPLPESYAKTRIELVTMLNELSALGGSDIKVNIYDGIEPFSEEAARAAEQYGIQTQTVLSQSRGTLKQEDIILGVAFTSGLEKVVVPFLDRGMPVEYELVRSIATVAHEERKKLGIVRTDAELFGGIDFQRMAPRPKQAIVDELEKQYDVVEVDPNNPIEQGTYDVLMVVQPSSLTQPQLDNLLEAIRAGIPTAIFEDPLPVAISSAPGTSLPKRPRGGMFGGGQPPEQKGDIQQLWDLLNIEMVGKREAGGFEAQVVWQDFNPYPKTTGFRQVTDQWVFVGPDAPGAEDALSSKDAITNKLSQLLFLFPGAIASRGGSDLTFTKLVTTGNQTGVIDVDALQSAGANPRFKQVPKAERYVMAAHITGKPGKVGAPRDPHAGHGHMHDHTGHDHGHAAPGSGPRGAAGEEGIEGESGEPATEKKEAAATEDPAKAEPKEKSINVVYVSDIDLMSSDFLQLRASPQDEIDWQFDNVTFVLNVLDSLADDMRFVEIRKRQIRHASLKRFEMRAAESRKGAQEAIEKAQKASEKAEKDVQEEAEKAVKKLQQRVDELQNNRNANNTAEMQAQLQSALINLAMKQRIAEQQERTTKERVQRDLQADLTKVNRDLDLELQQLQNGYKMWALVLPPIPPLLVALWVYISRSMREREGVSRTRRR